MQPIPQFVYGVYVPLAIAVVSLAAPMVGILLSIFSQGREEVLRKFQDELDKVTEDLKANEISKKHSTAALLWQMAKKRFNLMLLNPDWYLPLLVFPPIFSIGFAVLALHQHFYTFATISILLLVLYAGLLWSLIKLIAEITASRDMKKEERDRAVLETLQNLLKISDPATSLVKKAWITVNGLKLEDGMDLQSVTLGKEFEWKVSFNNAEMTLAAKQPEVGFQFPIEAFDIKKQSGYVIYEPENIARFNYTYIQKYTNTFFSTKLLVTPKRTGSYKVVAWLKGENVEARYFNLKINVETEA